MGINFYKIGVRMGVRTLTKIPVLISRFLVEGIKKTLQNKLKGCESRDGKIRTCDLLVPNQARYRATLHPELLKLYYTI